MIAISQSKLETRWDDVRLFLALYRRRTLAAAAAEVGLDASTLSRRLSSLEEALGGRLFDRTRDGLAPTEGAELLLPAAEEMAASHARFTRDAAGFEQAAEGTVRLSVSPGIAESFIAPALVHLYAKHPHIRIELDATIRFVDLTRREADLAIRSRRPQTGDLVSVKLGASPWTPMLAAARVKKRGVVKDWGELPWIGWGEDLATFPAEIWLERHVPRAAVVLRTSHFTTQLGAVASGLGAALLPSRFARVAAVLPIRTGAALADSVSELPTTEPWLVGHRALRSVPRVAAVWSFLVEEWARVEQDGKT
jgi:DNA-binding transcriptional LysR family regulator